MPQRRLQNKKFLQSVQKEILGKEKFLYS